MNIQQIMRDIIAIEVKAMANIKISSTFETAVKMILNCSGKVVTTGMGKAGYVAGRFAATLSSTGTPGVFVHPAEAGHGDLGLLMDDDIVLAFSTSGKSIELIEMLQNAADMGFDNVIGITSHTQSPLRDLSKLILDMGADIEEACPLGLTPSTTIAVMSAICDAIALTLIDLKGFTREDYGKRHHKGYLGSITRKLHQYDS